MRPDTPADPTDHTAEAERLLRTAAQYPEDAEQLLLHAAAHLELAGDRPQATTLYDRLLSGEDLDDPALIRALKAANLWEYGHEAEARAIIERWRRDYNTTRPHSAHGGLTPAEARARAAADRLRFLAVSADRPLPPAPKPEGACAVARRSRGP